MYRRNFLRITRYTMADALAAGCSIGGKLVTAETGHRPWPMPETRWAMSMRWHDLLFLHWPVHPKLIRPLIPREIDLDTFDGQCWIGIVPFHMSGVRLRYVPISLAFAELNVRTYVKIKDRPGVWFFGLDASSWLAVRAARCMNLPYYDAEMKVEGEGAEVKYRSARIHGHPAAEFEANYRQNGDVYHAAPGTLDHWLTERYRLYAAFKPEPLVYGDIHHRQWPLQTAEVEVRVNTMTRPIGVELPDTSPLCHFARYQEVVAWPVVKLNQ